MADEISNVVADWNLATDAEIIDSMRLQVTPQQRFGACHRSAERSRSAALSLADGCVRHVGFPPSLSLPHKGGGNPQTAACVCGLIRKQSAAHPLNPPAKVGKSSGRKP